MNDVERLPVPPVVKSVRVAVPPGVAFARFTEGIGRWWPLATHSIAKAEAETCAFEPFVGGRLYERARGGAEHVWGRVEAWEPGRRVAFTWHVGKPPSDAQTVEVTFAPDGDGCLVRLEHRGWDEAARATRDQYDQGWEMVLGRRYAAAAAAA